MARSKAKNRLSDNLWKFFLFSLSQRRQYIPILAIFFLTLPNTTAQQIGIYSGAGYLASFLFEIPSGYFADKFGHKKTLVFGKILMILSTTLFILADSLSFFVLGMIFLSVSFAFGSGTGSSFVHDTLIQLKREKDFTKVMSRITAYASLISVFLIIGLPFFTKISIILPLQINLVFDILGFFAVISLVSPKREGEISKKPSSLIKIIKESSNPGFYIISVFVGVIAGFVFSSANYKEVYLQSLGYPIILIGLVMGLSRFIWFLTGTNAHIIERKISLKKLFKLEIIIFPLLIILAGLFSNPFIVGFFIVLYLGYFFGRNQIIEAYFIRKLIKNKRYKATMLSVKSEISSIFKAVFVFLIGFVMVKSFRLGYIVSGISLFVILVILYIFMEKYLVE